ncbi:MAG TPA: hypothetical protein VMQ40_01150 [Acidimicrobiales bacterium]|nr:hypothetical protein [Acidimicrobiales bacterium]
MLERHLSRLIRTSMRRAGAERSVLWGAIGIAAYAMRRSLRDGGEVKRVRVKRGHEVTIAVRDRDG